MIRKSRKINKQRGSRTIGGGCSEKRRGAGNRGGRGGAGAGKQHWTWTVIHDRNHFGKYGFKRPQRVVKKHTKVVNLNFLDAKSEELLEKGIASKDGDSVVIDVTDLGYEKVLAKGNLTKALTIKAPAFSASAVSKIEEAGGEAIEL